jgi:hypothetical protein
MTFLEDYNRGFEMLSLSAEVFARLSQRIGRPTPNKDIPTARVSFDKASKTILFEMNPDYIAKLSDEEIGAVISHENFHVLLDHFADLPDRKKYPNLQALIHAQECIINDALFGNVGLSLPEGVFSGPEMYQKDFSLFSTKEGYDFIMGDDQPEESDSVGDPSESSSNSSSSSSDPSDSSQSGQTGDSTDENDSKTDQTPSGDDSSKEEKESDKTDEKNDGASEPSDQKEDSDGSGDSDSEDFTDGDSSDNDDASSDDSENSESDSDGSDDSDQQDGSGDPNSDEDDSPNENDSSDTHEDQHMCGGIEISEEDIQDFKDALSDAINSAMKDIAADSVPNYVTDAIEAISHEEGMSINASDWSIGAVDKSTEFLSQSGSDLDLNWKALLARINPKINSAGRPRQKESWHAPRRKMIASYPEVILPTYRRMDDPENKGDSVPVFILALDMSYSIPEYLIQKLASLADSIPKDIIRPYPVTWSNDVLPFDTETRRIVRRSGTNIDNVYEYAQKLEKETKTKPYVLVITDGDCNFGGHDSMLPSRMDRKLVADRWFWMATEPKKLSLIRKNFGGYSAPDKIYSIADFL